jgi:hypothetical protein
MNIYIDCEWNGFGGKLISMALVADNGFEFYEVLGCEHPCEWVAEHVMPILNKDVVSLDEFNEKLESYLDQFSEVNILADWPEDIERFCASLITGPGERLNTPPLKMMIVRIDAESAIPHNALEDARGIKAAIHALLIAQGDA